jgi:hypothetical protein
MISQRLKYELTWLHSMVLVYLAIAFSALVLNSCTGETPDVAGGWIDTETGKKVSGVIIREDGQPAMGALIQLRPSDYLGRDPTTKDSIGVSLSGGSKLDNVCDSLGRFSFDSVAVGNYFLESRNQEINAVLIRFEIKNVGVGIKLAPAMLKPVGSITGRVRFSDDVPGPALVRIRGLERAVLVNPATGVYTFGNIPAGTFNLVFSGLEPLVSTEEKSGVTFSAGSGTNAGEVVLQRGLKQSFKMSAGMLEIAGVDSTNPVIIENGAFWSAVDGAYLWAKASMGHLDLRGTIVSYAKDTGEVALQANMMRCRHLIKLARNSGMRIASDPIAGARRKLGRPKSGNLMDIEPDMNDGVRLLIREAHKATVEKPLILISGSNLTTAAEALLFDPTIADRMIVFGANNGNINKEDSLAIAIVTKKARLVEWARDYYWDTTFTGQSPARFPTHQLGESLRSQFSAVAGTPWWAYSSYGDFGAATFLFKPKVWSNARSANLKSPSMLAEVTQATPYDFIDIPVAANNWTMMDEEFYATVANPAAYHPWPLPGSIEAEAYEASYNVRVDSSRIEQDEITTWNGIGSWSDYSVQVDSLADYDFEIRYQADVDAQLGISDRAGGSVISLDLTAGSAWITGKITLHLEPGIHRLRIENRKGTFSLNWMHIL